MYAPFIVSVLVFSATMLFFVAVLVHLGYVRGRQTLVQKIKQDDRSSIVDEAARPDPASGGKTLRADVTGPVPGP